QHELHRRAERKLRQIWIWIVLICVVHPQRSAERSERVQVFQRRGTPARQSDQYEKHGILTRPVISQMVLRNGPIWPPDGYTGAVRLVSVGRKRVWAC